MTRLPRRDLEPVLLSAGAVVGLTVAVFSELLFLGRVPFERDIHSLLWGQCAAFARVVKEGAWPVWNPWLGFGQPMLANPGAQVLYPLTWLNLAIRPEDYVALYAVLHLAWAVRGAGARPLAAVHVGRVGRGSGRLHALRPPAGLAEPLAALRGSGVDALGPRRRAPRRGGPEARPRRTLGPGPVGPTAERLAGRRVLYEGREPLLASLYLGLPAAALATASLFSRRRGLAVSAFLLGAGSLLVALGRFGFAYDWFRTAFPPLGLFRYPVKATLLAALAQAALAATGFEAWREGRVSGRRALLVATLAGGGGAAALVAVRWLYSEAPRFLSSPAGAPAPRGALEPVLSLATWSAALAVVVGCAAALSTTRGSQWASIAAAAAVLDLLVVHRALNPSIPRAQVQATPTVVEQLRADHVGRLLAFDYMLKPVRGQPPPEPPLARVPRAWGLVALEQQYPSSTPRWGIRGSFDMDVVGLESGERQSLRALAIALRGDPPRLRRLLQACAVTHVQARQAEGLDELSPLAIVETASAGDVYLFRVKDPLPRVFLATGLLVATGVDAQRALLDPTSDPRVSAIVPAGSARPPRPISGRLEVRDEKADRLTVRVTTDVPGLLVVVDGYDPGWKAAVDGRRAALERTNVDFRGVAVPAGTHEVRLIYRPSRLVAGLLVTVVSLVAGTGLLAAARRRARPRPHPLPASAPPADGAPVGGVPRGSAVLSSEP